MLLTRRQLMAAIDTAQIERAIEAAEAATSGEIRVSVAPVFWGSVRRQAERAFDRLGMTATRDRNGVLLFVVPARRRFAVLGDQGIHARLGDRFWRDVAALIAQCFKAGDYNGGLVAAIELVGRELAREFPWSAATGEENVNQLPSTVDFNR